MGVSRMRALCALCVLLAVVAAAARAAPAATEQTVGVAPQTALTSAHHDYEKHHHKQHEEPPYGYNEEPPYYQQGPSDYYNPGDVPGDGVPAGVVAGGYAVVNLDLNSTSETLNLQRGKSSVQRGAVMFPEWPSGRNQLVPAQVFEFVDPTLTILSINVGLKSQGSANKLEVTVESKLRIQVGYSQALGFVSPSISRRTMVTIPDKNASSPILGPLTSCWLTSADNSFAPMEGSLTLIASPLAYRGSVREFADLVTDGLPARGPDDLFDFKAVCTFDKSAKRQQPAESELSRLIDDLTRRRFTNSTV